MKKNIQENKGKVRTKKGKKRKRRENKGVRGRTGGEQTVTDVRGTDGANGRSTFIPGISPDTNVTSTFVPIGLYRLNTRYK
jgi:hypothetical protein